MNLNRNEKMLLKLAVMVYKLPEIAENTERCDNPLFVG